MPVSLPALNAILNFSSAVLLAAGYLCIRQGRIAAHRFCMSAAFTMSVLFLISYLTHHWRVGHVRYTGEGGLRTLYLSILASHTILAVAIVPLVWRTLYLALNGRWDEHRRLARWTLPAWFYVSVTGVIIYEMLY